MSLARERIKQRVKQGGHHVPDVDVERRLERSLGNFFGLYMPLADAWDIFDNSSIEPVLIVKFNEKGLQVFNKPLYQQWINGKGSYD